MMTNWRQPTQKITRPLNPPLSPWWVIWAILVSAAILLTLAYSQLPVDGFTGDLESFAAEDNRGFLLRYKVDTRESPLQDGDILARVDGYTLDEWLAGIPNHAGWQSGAIIRYHILRDDAPLLLDVPQQPMNVVLAFLSYPPRVIIVLTFFGLGTFVLWKRPEDGAAQRLMLFCMIGALAYYGDLFNFQFSILVHPPLLSVQLFWEQFFYGLQYVAGLNFALFFPQKHPLLQRYPRLFPLITFLVYVVPVTLSVILADDTKSGLVNSNRVAILCANLLLVFAIVVYTRVLRQVKNPIQRSQTLWILWSAILASVSLIPLYFLPLLLNTDTALSITIPYVLSAVIPISLTIAVLRFRLFAIDLVINRSLVYGAVTIILGLLFIVVIRLLQPLFGLQDNTAITIFGAVLVGLLFNPTRYRMQRFVDRRLYGFRFDLNDLRRAGRKPTIHNPGLYTGRMMGDYELMDVLAVGGMGEVYQGYCSGQTVAVKILLPTLAEDPEFRTRFEREAQITAHFHHPNIVRYLQSGVQDGISYLALELVEGTDLKTYLRQQGRLSFAETLTILRDVAAALDVIHTQGYVHRDLKPANIVLRTQLRHETFSAVLMDFGVSKSPDENATTGSGAVGTIDYMAPEQVQELKTIDARADIYALGVLTYEMLTGELPYKGTLAQVLFAHLHQPVPDPGVLVANLPGNACYAVMRAMSKDAVDRYASAGAFVNALS